MRDGAARGARLLARPARQDQGCAGGRSRELLYGLGIKLPFIGAVLLLPSMKLPVIGALLLCLVQLIGEVRLRSVRTADEDVREAATSGAARQGRRASRSRPAQVLTFGR